MQKGCTRAVAALTCWTVSTRPLASGSRLWRQQRRWIGFICAPHTTATPDIWSPLATRPVRSHCKTWSYTSKMWCLSCEWGTAVMVWLFFSYEKSDTHRVEVPRMLQDDTLSLETYVKEKNDKCVSSDSTNMLRVGGRRNQMFSFLQTKV